MKEDPSILRMNIDRYRALLNLDLDYKKRLTIERLLAEANQALVDLKE